MDWGSILLAATLGVMAVSAVVRLPSQFRARREAGALLAEPLRSPDSMSKTLIGMVVLIALLATIASSIGLSDAFAMSQVFIFGGAMGLGSLAEARSPLEFREQGLFRLTLTPWSRPFTRWGEVQCFYWADEGKILSNSWNLVFYLKRRGLQGRLRERCFLISPARKAEVIALLVAKLGQERLVSDPLADTGNYGGRVV